MHLLLWLAGRTTVRGWDRHRFQIEGAHGGHKLTVIAHGFLCMPYLIGSYSAIIIMSQTMTTDGQAPGQVVSLPGHGVTTNLVQLRLQRSSLTEEWDGNVGSTMSHFDPTFLIYSRFSDIESDLFVFINMLQKLLNRNLFVFSAFFTFCQHF